MIHNIVNSWRLEDRWRDREDHQRKKEKRERTVVRNGEKKLAWRSLLLSESQRCCMSGECCEPADPKM